MLKRLLLALMLLPMTLPGANMTLAFTNGGDASWEVQTYETHDGIDAAQSGCWGTGVGRSSMGTGVVGPGTVSFWWKVSESRNGGNALHFYVDGKDAVPAISGGLYSEQDWTKVICEIPSGPHALRWSYEGYYFSSMDDCGWVDQIDWTSTAEVYSVGFDANGGSCPVASQTVTNGATYGTLPTPTRAGCTFGGWFTSAFGGTRVTSATRVSLTGGQTLYAHWPRADLVRGFEARQRSPWNGLVDVSVTFQCAAEEIPEMRFQFVATNITTETSIPVVAIRQVGDDAGSGNHWTRRFVWDAVADVGATKIDDVALTVQAELGGEGVQLWENGPYWAECNVGAANPQDFGFYFWWGDVIGYRCEDDRWKAVDGSCDDFSFVYNNCPIFREDDRQLQLEGYIDAAGGLLADHDAARAHLGAPWRMPTGAEIRALVENCTTAWTTSNGVYGRLVTGRGAYASRSIFLPDAGYAYRSWLFNTSLHSSGWIAEERPLGFYLSSSSSMGPEWGYGDGLVFTSDRFAVLNGCGIDERGRAVRPVREFSRGIGSSATTHLGLGGLGLAVATTVSARPQSPWNGLVDITVTFQGVEDEVAKRIECTFTATNSATNVAIPVTITQDKGITGAEDVWTRTFVWEAGSDVGWLAIADVALTVDARVNWHGGVQLWDDGPYWAECNVGAAKPEEFGFGFCWGNTVGYVSAGVDSYGYTVRNAVDGSWSGRTRWSDSYDLSLWTIPLDNETFGMSDDQLRSTGYVDTTGNLAAAHDAATVHCGAPWRMPSQAEFHALESYCVPTWTNRNGVSGWLMTGRGRHVAKSIFLPAAFPSTSEERGLYWTSTPDNDGENAECFMFEPYWTHSMYVSYKSRISCCSVRPIRDEGRDTGCRMTTHLALGEREGVSVIAVTATPRSPRNGLVDVSVTLQGPAADVAKATCSFVALDDATKTEIPVKNLTSVGDDVGAGTYWTRKFVWNALVDAGPAGMPDIVLFVGVEMDHGGVQLWENGPYWAECNVGATKPEEYGYRFWWGGTEGILYDEPDPIPFRRPVRDCPTYDRNIVDPQSGTYVTAMGNLLAKYDAATVRMGAPWRMPTAAEFTELAENCTTLQTTRNGVAGLLVAGKGVYASKNIFLPLCIYWSSTADPGFPSVSYSDIIYDNVIDFSDVYSGCLWVEEGLSPSSETRHTLFPVRPVRGTARGTGFGMTTHFSLASVLESVDVTVTFDANGGSCAMDSKTVTNGSMYGMLPTATRSGYTFDGWFTSVFGGTQVTDSTRVVLTGAQTLYARWTPTLGVALDNTTLTFTSGGEAGWSGQTAVTHDGVGAAQSGTIGHGKRSSFETTVTGPGTLTFWWKVSSESGFDKLHFSVDGTDAVGVAPISGTMDWTRVSYAVASGSHTLAWSYEKDGSASDGSDCGWVDQVVWTPIASYTVTFNANGGSCTTPSKTVTNGSTYGTLPTPTRSGYMFAGWYTAASGGMQVTDSTPVSLSGAQTLYAHWIAGLAGEYVWTGAQDAYWTNAANWTVGGAVAANPPGWVLAKTAGGVLTTNGTPADVAVFGACASGRTTIDLDGQWKIDSVVFTNEAPAYTLGTSTAKAQFLKLGLKATVAVAESVTADQTIQVLSSTYDVAYKSATSTYTVSLYNNSLTAKLIYNRVDRYEGNGVPYYYLYGVGTIHQNGPWSFDRCSGFQLHLTGRFVLGDTSRSAGSRVYSYNSQATTELAGNPRIIELPAGSYMNTTGGSWSDMIITAYDNTRIVGEGTILARNHWNSTKFLPELGGNFSVAGGKVLEVDTAIVPTSGGVAGMFPGSIGLFGTGTLLLHGTNTCTGAVRFHDAATLAVTRIGAAGCAAEESCLGTGSEIRFYQNGTLRYVGDTPDGTDRSFTTTNSTSALTLTFANGGKGVFTLNSHQKMLLPTTLGATLRLNAETAPIVFGGSFEAGQTWKMEVAGTKGTSFAVDPGMDVPVTVLAGGLLDVSAQNHLPSALDFAGAATIAVAEDFDLVLSAMPPAPQDGASIDFVVPVGSSVTFAGRPNLRLGTVTLNGAPAQTDADGKLVPQSGSDAPVDSGVVPHDWILAFFPGTTDFVAKTRETAANGRLTVEDCYVAGLDPRDVTAEFQAQVSVVDGRVYVSWTPNLNTESVQRIYTIYGRTDLDVGDWETPIKRWHRFFKVAVAMPTGADGEETAVAGEGFVPEGLGGVQLWENGPYWAECNVGATKPEEYGCYFWWGDTVGYKRNASDDGWESVKNGASFSFSAGNCLTYDKSTTELQSEGYIDATGNLVAKYDAATAHLGAPWRMPTDAEMSALVSNCTTTWTTHNGVYGRLVTGKGAFSTKSIFLPAAGFGSGSSLGSPGVYGYYWSSTPYSGDPVIAWRLSFYSNYINRSNSRSRDYGLPVRPVRGFAK